MIYGISCCPLNFPNQITHNPKTCSLMLFLCTSAVPLSYLIALSFSSKVSCTFYCFACKFSRSHGGFPLWNLIIVLNLVQIFATNKFLSEWIVDPGNVCSFFILHQKYIVQLMSNLISWCFPDVQISFY